MSRQWTGPPWRFHEVGFYRSDAEFGALIVPFVEEGVSAGQPVILGYDDRKASLLRAWLYDPAAVTFIADTSLYATPARAIDSYRRIFEELTAAGATQIRIAGDVPHEGNGGRFAGWDRYESAANTVWDQFPVWSRCLYDAATAAPRVLGVWYRYHHLFRDMLLAELERRQPQMMAVLRRRAAAWCLASGAPEEALEYSIAAGDVDQAAELVQSLFLKTYRQGRVTTLLRWWRWLEDRDGIEGHPRIAANVAEVAAATGRPSEAERWADAVDRWQAQHPARPADPVTGALAAEARAVLCRRGIEQMRADADEVARLCAAANMVLPVAAVLQGIARVLSGDIDGGDGFLADAISIGESGAPDVFAAALCERSLVAMARGHWDRAEALASQAAAALRRAGIEDCYIHPPAQRRAGPSRD